MVMLTATQQPRRRRAHKRSPHTTRTSPGRTNSYPVGRTIAPHGARADAPATPKAPADHGPPRDTKPKPPPTEVLTPRPSSLRTKPSPATSPPHRNKHRTTGRPIGQRENKGTRRTPAQARERPPVGRVRQPAHPPARRTAHYAKPQNRPNPRSRQSQSRLPSHRAQDSLRPIPRVAEIPTPHRTSAWQLSPLRPPQSNLRPISGPAETLATHKEKAPAQSLHQGLGRH
jgi:hypothetical protein